MKTITITAAEERTIIDALQMRKNKMTREAQYMGVTPRQKDALVDQAIKAKVLQHKIINSK